MEHVRVVEPTPFGYDNYGNAVVEHPYAYINDETGTYAIEDEISHHHTQQIASRPAPVVAAPVWEPVVVRP